MYSQVFYLTFKTTEQIGDYIDKLTKSTVNKEYLHANNVILRGTNLYLQQVDSHSQDVA